jgi:uncharacterized protein (DUF1800 family)
MRRAIVRLSLTAMALVVSGCAQHPVRHARVPETPSQAAARSVQAPAAAPAAAVYRGDVAASTAPLPTITHEQAAAIWRVASRLGYGPTPALMQAVVNHPRGAQGWALDQIDRGFAASRQAPNIPAELSTFNQPIGTIFAEFRAEREARRDAAPRLQQAGNQTVGNPPGGGPSGGAAMSPQDLFSVQATRSAAAWRLAACSNPQIENPLTARLTEFWFNHFNVFSGKGSVRPFVGHYVANAIRPNVLGRFEDLVIATSRHPAMLFYLDQAQSVAEGGAGARGQARGLNENYARELMELHTLGVNGGYSQADVRELARILTGWTVDPNGPSGFRFAANLHDANPKTLLGHSFSNDGEREGLRAIALLSQQPATANRIAKRLAQWFIADEPSPALVQRLATVFRNSGGDLRQTMRAVVSAPEFWDPSSTLFKTPLDFACSAMLVQNLASPGPLVDRPDIRLGLGFLQGAGQPMHGWQTPDGYKTDAATWLAPEALTRRADFAMNLARNAPPPPMVQAFLSPATRDRIAREPAGVQGPLMLASPDFMKK